MKRYVSLLVAIAVALVLLVATWPTLAAPNVALPLPVVSIQPASRLVFAGQTFTLSLVVNNAANLGAYEATIWYDPSKVALVAATHPSPSFLAVAGRTAARPPGEPMVNSGRVTVGEYTTGSATTG